MTTKVNDKNILGLKINQEKNGTYMQNSGHLCITLSMVNIMHYFHEVENCIIFL